jgi:hypothetical protein
MGIFRDLLRSLRRDGIDEDIAIHYAEHGRTFGRDSAESGAYKAQAARDSGRKVTIMTNDAGNEVIYW